MTLRRLLFICSLIILVIVLVLFATGSKWLLISLSPTRNIPSGTFITWLGFIALPTCLLLGINRLYTPINGLDRTFRKLIFLAIVMAVLWVPVSYGLAGNISFSFTEKVDFRGGQEAMKWFWRFTYGIPIFSISVVLLFVVLARLKKSH